MTSRKCGNCTEPPQRMSVWVVGPRQRRCKVHSKGLGRMGSSTHHTLSVRPEGRALRKPKSEWPQPLRQGYMGRRVCICVRQVAHDAACRQAPAPLPNPGRQWRHAAAAGARTRDACLSSLIWGWLQLSNCTLRPIVILKCGRALHWCMHTSKGG